MAYRAGTIWFLLLAAETCRVGSQRTDPLCFTEPGVTFTCSNYNSTEELNLNIFEVASTNNTMLTSSQFLNLENINNFVPNTLNISPYLVRMNVSFANISMGSRGFNEFTSLTSLIIRDSHMEICEDTFHDLHKLKELQIVDTHLSNLPENWQIGTTNLTFLRFHNNGLRNLDNQPFKSLEELLVLHVSENNITEVPYNLFQYLNRLIGLVLDSNQISTLPKGLFNGVPELLYLNLSNNFLGSLEPGMFQNLKGLRYLYLSGNDFKVLKQSYFMGLGKLKTLFVDNNKINALITDLFKYLPKIEYLHLEHNRITNVQEGAFRGLKRLEYLELLGNKIETFPADAFGNNIALQYVNLANNTIKSLYSNNCFNQSNTAGLLEDEFLNCNKFNGLATLEYLDLESNKIVSLSLGELKVFPNLKYVKLDGNLLGSEVLQQIYNEYEHVYEYTPTL